ncbi:MAG TPA: HesA/MoeB/ThiF family protein [Candidatus Binataceae bacterium]|nr:HesA/MoeB/ThiF family protein [Candidatus Binataceae bacterium]
MPADKRILIVGAGGLGVPAALALVRAGIRDFAMMDPDPVELSNLARQMIYGEVSIGIPKVMAAAAYFSRNYAHGAIEPMELRLDDDNAEEIIRRFGFVIDATDSPAAKFLINDTCVALGRPFVYGGVLGLSGQAMTVLPGHSACLRCLFEDPPDEADAASCRDAGILGPVAGAIGEVQAAEAMAWANGRMPTLAGMMLTLDGSTSGRIRPTPIAARSGCGCGAAQPHTSAELPAAR